MKWEVLWCMLSVSFIFEASICYLYYTMLLPPLDLKPGLCRWIPIQDAKTFYFKGVYKISARRGGQVVEM